MTMKLDEAADPTTMEADALRAEVWFWRTTAADRIRELQAAIDAAFGNGAQQLASDLRSELARWTTLLSGALIGDALDKCGLCGEVIVPGQPALREVDNGDVHADCLGDHIDGDRYQLDPEGVVDADDEPIPDGDGVLTSHPYRPLRTLQEMVSLVGGYVDA